MNVDDALKIIAQERLDVRGEAIAQGCTEQEAIDQTADIAAYVLHDAVLKDRKYIRLLQDQKLELIQDLERALNDDATIARLVAALVDFANWRRPSKRDWDNGAVQDEFDSMQKQARLALVMNYGQPSSGGSGSQRGRPDQSESGAP